MIKGLLERTLEKAAKVLQGRIPESDLLIDNDKALTQFLERIGTVTSEQIREAANTYRPSREEGKYVPIERSFEGSQRPSENITWKWSAMNNGSLEIYYLHNNLFFRQQE